VARSARSRVHGSTDALTGGIDMSSHEVIALVTDALRGQLVAVLPSTVSVLVGAPSVDGHAMEGVFVHPLRIALSQVRRNEAVVRRADSGVLPPALDLELDYLIAGLGGEALAELALLDAALQWVMAHPVRTHDTMGEGLSQPARWAPFASGSLTVRWRLLDLPLEQTAAIWAGTGMRQRAGLLVRADVHWQAGETPSGPIVEI
jgi:hypothetical protein